MFPCFRHTYWNGSPPAIRRSRPTTFVGYAAQRAVSFRVNTLKATVPAVLEQLQTAGIATTPVAWSETAFFCTDSTKEAQLQALSCYENGEIYLQSLSSMLPPIVLQPQPKQEILDMTAAPGGKTTQMAAMTQNQANIMACELHAIRAEKLKYNVEKQGAKRVTVSVTDARRLSPYFSFDRILLDAPCSGSGTLSLHTGAGLQNFSPAGWSRWNRPSPDFFSAEILLFLAGHAVP